WTTTLATLRWTKSSPGIMPRISLAGTRLSAQPIHRYSGFCWRESFSKKSGIFSVTELVHSRFLSKSSFIAAPVASEVKFIQPGRVKAFSRNSNRLSRQRRAGSSRCPGFLIPVTRPYNGPLNNNHRAIRHGTDPPVRAPSLPGHRRLYRSQRHPGVLAESAADHQHLRGGDHALLSGNRLHRLSGVHHLYPRRALYAGHGLHPQAG